MQRPRYITPPEKVVSPARRRAVTPVPGGGASTGDTPAPSPIVPPAQPAPNQLQLRSRTFRANTEPLMPGWGSIKGLGGQLWVEEPLADGGFLCMWAINYGPSSAISNIRFDTGTFATYGMAQGTHWNQYLGTPTQVMDPIAAAALGTAWTNLPYPAWANIVVAPFATVTAALSSTGSQTVTPSSMADIRVGDVISAQNSDGAPGFPGTHFERVTVTAVTATTFTAVFASTKSANWQLVITTNISYVVAHFPAAQPGQPQPNFESFRCDHDGLLVYDPVQDATVTSKFFVAEPVLAHADYWTSKVYGKGEPVSSIDWTGSVAVTTALQRFNIGGGVKRYQLGLRLPSKASHDQNSDIIRSHGQGLTPVFNSGNWQFWMDWIQSPSGIVLTDSGPNANILNKPAWRFKGRQSRPTRTRVSYPNPNGIAKTEITPPNDDPLLASGLVELVEKTWNLDGSPADDQSQRLNRYFRKSSAIDRETTIRVTNDGVQILPYIIVNVTSQRLHCVNAPCVVLNVANADPSSGQPSAWDVTVQPYDAAVHDDTAGSVTSTTPGTFASPDTPPPTPANPVLTQVGFDINVSFVPVGTYPFYLRQKITVDETTAAGVVMPTYVLGEAMTGPLTIKKVNMGSLYTVKAYVINWALLLSTVAATATITPAMAQIPPDVTVAASSSYISATLPNGAASISFPKPNKLSTTLYGAGSLTPTNLHSYDGTKVNDGVTSAACFDWNVSGASRVAVNLGSAKTISFVWVYTSAFASDPIIETSNDGVAWSGGFSSNPVSYVADIGGGVSLRVYAAPGGSHQWVAVTKASSLAEATTFTEIWPRETTATQATADDIVRYNIYGFSPPGPGPFTVYDARHLYGSIDFGQEPTVTAPFDVNAIAFHNPSSWPQAFGVVGGQRTIAVYVTTVSPGGVESPGFLTQNSGTFTASGVSLPLDQITLQGADIASATTTSIGAGTGRNINITGTTTITAFDTVAAGIERVLKFAGILTLTHNGTSLILPGAANIVTAAGDQITCLSLGSGNWRCRDYTRAAIPPPTGVTGTGKVAYDTSPQVTGLNVTDGVWLLKSMGFLSVAIDLTNTAGTLQHAIYDCAGSGSTSNFTAPISGASAVFANTPAVSGVVDFTSGAGVDSSGTNRLVLNTNAFTVADTAIHPVVEFNSTATAVHVQIRPINLNINGVTKVRLALGFSTDPGGTAFNLNTTNIAAGQIIRVRLWGFLP